MTQFIIARLDTAHFTFDAIGGRKNSALAALHRGLLAHGKQYRLPPDWFMGMDIECRAFQPGKAYRDGEVIK